MSAPPAWASYMEDVLSGRRLAGELERLNVERTLRLVQQDHLFFDFVEAELVLEIVSYFRHTKGKYAGKPFELMPWQEYILVCLFAVKYVDSGLRLFRKALLCVPKKNGKSEFAGAIAVLMTFFEAEEGAECYSAANKYDQAKFSWEAGMKILKRLRRESEEINGKLRIYDSTNNRNVVNSETDSFFKPISADSRTLDGVNPHLAIIDEYHEAKDSSIPNNMESGMVSREQPLLLIITTRGFNIQGPLYRLEESYIRILRGTAENENVFPMIYTLDEGDNWEDERLWEKANPGLGRTPLVSGLRGEYQKAITEGAAYEVNFLTKSLNVWTSVAERWIPDANFVSGCTDWDVSELDGLMCFGGLDLAKTRDLTAIAYLFPPQAGFDKFRVLMRYYLPRDSAIELERKDIVPYRDWDREGWMTLTAGNVIDNRLIERDILADAERYDLRGISYDPYNATAMATNLTEQEVPMNAMAQNTSNFNEPITELEKTIMRAELDHRSDPVLRWMAGNVVILTDANGNRKFNKAKSRQKIDGMVALAEAFAEYLTYKLEEPPEFTITWND